MFGEKSHWGSTIEAAITRTQIKIILQGLRDKRRREPLNLMQIKCFVHLKRTCLRLNPETKVCVIRQTKKYDKSKKRILPIAQGMTFEAGDKLLQASEIRKDDRIVRELSERDPIAREVCYHHGCYVRYAKKRCLKTTFKR